MRKDADYQVNDRVQCLYSTEQEALGQLIDAFREFFQQEALLSSVERGEQQ
ncbi:MAG: hypothetical protein H6765_00650 [Candidatus Peribacteria bacterium]|nr:MAG: hypothetical protein H6765_00650 [Candidatus Peribacteria bacterium]